MKLAAIAAWMLLLFQTPQPAPKASIEGTIVRIGTGEPVAGAQVNLARVSAGTVSIPGSIGGTTIQGIINTAGGGTVPGVFNVAEALPKVPDIIPSVTSDRQGRFSIKDLEPGSYRLTVAINGYVRQEYGQSVTGGPGTSVVVGEGQALKNIEIRLTPTGSVSGRIQDNAGNPLAGIDVELLRSAYNQNGQKIFQSAGSARTDDRGDYRAFWITPGRYYVLAGSASSGPPRGVNPNEVPVQAIAPTYYPNEIDVSRASRLNVQPGAELNGVDFQLSRQDLYRIRGRVIDSRTGQPPASAFITLLTPIVGGGIQSRGFGQSYNPANGTFELRDVAPGSYVVRVDLTTYAGPGAGGARVGQAFVNVNVSSSDVENVILNVVPSASISGSLTVDGQALSAISGLDRTRITLRPSVDGIVTTNLQAPPPQPQATKPDGTFAIDNVTPGEYRLSVPLPAGYYVKEARFDQSDVLNQPLQFSGRVSGTLDVVISSKSAQVDGTVVDAQSQPAPGIQAVLIPDRFRDRTDLYKTATTDQNGHFTIRGIPPGDYRVFAWETIEPYAYFDSDLVSQVEQQGRPVHLPELSKETVEVKIIPAGQ